MKKLLFILLLGLGFSQTELTTRVYEFNVDMTSSNTTHYIDLYEITGYNLDNAIIEIIGIDDYQTTDNQIKNNLALENKTKFNLTLVHKSSIWHKIFDNTDLMLAGHTHNGQIFPFNLFVKIKFKYSFGLYRNKNSYLYVSSGSGCWGPRMRLGTSNEIVNVELIPYKS